MWEAASGATELEEAISRVGRNQIFQRDLQAVSGKCLQKARLSVLCCLSTQVRLGHPSMSHRPPCMACETQPVILMVSHRPPHWACESLCAQGGNSTTGVLATAWHCLKIPRVTSHYHVMLKKETKSMMLVHPSPRYRCLPDPLTFEMGGSNHLVPHPDNFKSVTWCLPFFANLLFQINSFQYLETQIPRFLDHTYS